MLSARPKKTRSSSPRRRNSAATASAGTTWPALPPPVTPTLSDTVAMLAPRLVVREFCPVKRRMQCRTCAASIPALAAQGNRHRRTTEIIRSMQLDTGAGLLHRLTSYRPDRKWDVPADDPRLRHDLVPNDPQTVPPSVKEYDQALPVTPLPRDLPQPGVSATAVLAGAPAPAQPLEAAQLGRILFLGGGVVRTTERNGRRMLFRASGSAGGRYPLEIYASTLGVEGVPDGVHWYDPAAHALVQVGPPAGGGGTTLVVTGIPWRTGWRYAERGWRHLYWDGGTLLSQLSAAAASAGLQPRLRTLFPDAAVRDLVGAEGVHEYPLALPKLGGERPATHP